MAYNVLMQESPMKKRRTWCPLIVLAGLMLVVPGCYEETDEAPQPQAQGAPSSERANEGMIGPVHQTGSSALGKAKSAAENIAAQAEAHSQKVADQADEIVGSSDDDGE